MTVFVEIALVVALGLTWLIAVLVRSNRRLSGPDRAGAAIVYFLVTPVRWLALALGLGVALDAGGFAWIGVGIGTQWLLVFLVHLAAGAASVLLLAAAGDRPAPRFVWPACLLVSYALPVAIAAQVAVVLEPELAQGSGGVIVRVVLIAVLALGAAATAAAALPVLAASRRRRDRDRRARVADTEERVAAGMAEVDALADAPLARWLDMSGDNHPTDVQARVLAAIAARPTLIADLAAMLAGNEAEEALRYIRWRMETSPAELARPICDALFEVAARMRRRIEAMETPFAGQFELEVDQAVDLAHRFHSADADFRPALRHTRAALDLATGRTAAPDARIRLDAWLKRA